MSANIVTIEAGEVSYESDMPIGALKSVLKAAGTGDLDGIIKGLSEFVLTWPFDSDPADPAAWDALRRSEFTAIIAGIMEGLGTEGK